MWTQLLTVGHRVTRPKNPPVWANYHRHIEYRNASAHGKTWGDTATFASVVATGQSILRLDDQMRQVDNANADF